jgi:hypothetical protein
MGMENARRNTQTKSPLELAKTALESAREAIPHYSSRFSRHDFTQHQLYALVALRRLLKTDYRGLEATIRDWAELRDALGLVRVPDHSTIQRAEHRFHAQPKSRPKAKARVKSRPTGEPAEAMPLFDRTGPAPADVPTAPIAVSAA